MIEWVFSGIGVAALVGLSGMAVARPAQYSRLVPLLGARGSSSLSRCAPISWGHGTRSRQRA